MSAATTSGDGFLDPASIPTLPVMLSAPRLATYLAECGGNISQAVRLYTWNLEISAAFWGEIHALEVTLRNAMHDQLRNRFGREDWWNDSAAKLHHVMTNQLADAVKNVNKTTTRQTRAAVPGDVVAALSFGFWTGLTGKGSPLQYETLYWQPTLVHAFPHYTGTRGALNQQLETLRLLRNRIAHHEPILARALRTDHNLIIQIAGYLNPDAANYIAGLSRVPAVINHRSAAIAGTHASF